MQKLTKKNIEQKNIKQNFFKKISTWSKKLLTEGLIITSLASCSFYSPSSLSPTYPEIFNWFYKKELKVKNKVTNLLDSSKKQDFTNINEFKKFFNTMQELFKAHQYLVFLAFDSMLNGVEISFYFFESDYSRATSSASELRDKGYTVKIIFSTSEKYRSLNSLNAGRERIVEIKGYYVYATKILTFSDFLQKNPAYPYVLKNSMDDFKTFLAKFLEAVEEIKSTLPKNSSIIKELEEFKKKLEEFNNSLLYQALYHCYYLNSNLDSLLNLNLDSIKTKNLDSIKTQIVEYSNTLNSYSAIKEKIFSELEDFEKFLKISDSIKKANSPYYRHEETVEVPTSYLPPLPPEIQPKISNVFGIYPRSPTDFNSNQIGSLKNNLNNIQTSAQFKLNRIYLDTTLKRSLDLSDTANTKK